MATGDTFELDITDIVYGGNAFGRHEGKAVFVPYALPGERVEVRIIDERKRYAVAEVVRVLDAAPQRVTPPCPYFGPGLCGGCQWQHIDYPAQLAYKEKIVRDQLTRFGGLVDPLVHPVIASPDPWAYRSRATLHAAGDGQLGYIATDGRTIMPVETCLIIRPELLDAFQSLTADDIAGARRVRLQTGSGDDVIVIATADESLDDEQTSPPAPGDEPVQVADSVDTADMATVEIIIHGRTFQVTGGSFFQVNLPQAAMLVEHVLRRLELTGEGRLLDLYAGVGLFTAFLAAEARQVTAIEANPTAARDAQVNLAPFGNVLYIGDTVENALAKVSGRFDATVVDPPRSGLSRRALAQLVEHEPARIVYVSYDPASLARDTKALVAAGYTFVDAQPLDMFPQTHHVEIIATFVRA